MKENLKDEDGLKNEDNLKHQDDLKIFSLPKFTGHFLLIKHSLYQKAFSSIILVEKEFFNKDIKFLF